MPAQPVLRRLAAALALTAVTAACSGSDAVTGPGGATSVSVTAQSPSLVVGQTASLSAVVADAEGRPLSGQTIVWRSASPGVATVTGAGQVTAVAPGTVRIHASVGSKSGSVDLTVLPHTALVASITFDAVTLVLQPGETRQLTATPRDAAGQPVANVTLGWSAVGGGATLAATVSATGLVTARAMGTATVAANVNGVAGQVAVVVLGDATHDLVFDRWDTLGPFNHPWLARLDLRDPQAAPALLAGFQDLAGLSDAAPSPDGARLAYVCGGSSICVADRSGANMRIVAGAGAVGGFYADQPAWSPDGLRIAFRGWAAGGTPGLVNPTDVYVMDADGGNRVKLTNATAGVDAYEAPTWSPRQPDGSHRVAASHVRRDVDGYVVATIVSVRADGTDRRQVTAPGAYTDGQPSWSPDGQTIAFVRTGGEAGGDLWLVNATGGTARPLMAAAVEPQGEQRAPAWSADGALIAFTSSHEIIDSYFAWQVYTVRADGTGLVRRTSDRKDKGNPAWLKRP